MSRVRVYVDGRPDWKTCDDGAVGRVSYSRLGIRGGGPPVVFGAHATGESQRARDLRKQREAMGRARTAK